jgi:hypothetical protein
MSEFRNPGLWLDQNNAAEWSDCCRANLFSWISLLAGDGARASDLTVVAEPPTQDQAAYAFEKNTNLSGMVRIAWRGDEIRLRFKMPFCGVFLSARPELQLQKGLVSVWRSWLDEAPGFRLLRAADAMEKDDKAIRWRLGLTGGRRVEARLEGDWSSAAERLRESHYGEQKFYPEPLREHLSLIGLKSSEGADDLLGEIRKLTSIMETTAEDDLEHRFLQTFPVWLKHQISRELLNEVLKQKRNNLDISFGNRMSRVLRGEELGNEDFVSEVWAILKDRSSRVSDRISWAINSYSRENGPDYADYLDPINPLDLISRITRVRRVAAKRSDMRLIGAARRQNLPSFKGRLCPFESPESELVGLTMQLASGAFVDFDGRIHAATDAQGELGFGARLVPFLAHNDGARNMMGAKNLRQAVPLRLRQTPKVRTGGEDLIQKMTAPLVAIGLCPNADVETGEFGMGRDLLVAYMPWNGMNFEDAVVVGEQVAKRDRNEVGRSEGMMDLCFTQSFRKSIPRGWVPAMPDQQGILSWSDQEGLAKVGSNLFADSPIAHFVWEGKTEAEPLVIRHSSRTPSILKQIRFSRKSPWTEGALEYELEIPIPLKPGDKLMGRHGNKGVVGTILPASEMPRLPDSQSLPQHLRGRPIDLILNSHGVISRMNIGQLIETHIGWLLHTGSAEEDFRLESSGAGVPLAQPYASTVDHDKVQDLLEESGLDRYGRIKLSLPDGSETAAPVVVGFQHIVRLRHIPELKSQARRGDKTALYSARTGQAARGRKQGGGQRVGEMEMWALAAHQANHIIGEIQGIKSSAELLAQEVDPDFVKPGYTGYRRVFQDWLFALLIKVGFDSEKLTFGFANEKEVMAKGGSGRRVTSPAGMILAPTASFSCPAGGNRNPCNFRLLDGAKIAFPSTAGNDNVECPTLCLGDLLARFDLRVAGQLARNATDDGYEIPIIDLRTRKPLRPLVVGLEPAGTDALRGTIEIDPADSPPRWPEGLNRLGLYGRLPTGAGNNWQPPELIKEFMKSPEEKRKERANGTRAPKMSDRTLEHMRVCCPHHKPALMGVKPYGKSLYCEPGGLFDPLIFGHDMPTRKDATTDRWGVIELPFAVPYPKEVFNAFASGKNPTTNMCPMIKAVPVLPAHYRLPGKRFGGLVADRLDRMGYAPLIETCRQYAKKREETEAVLSKLREENSEVSKYAHNLSRLWEPLKRDSNVLLYIHKRSEIGYFKDLFGDIQKNSESKNENEDDDDKNAKDIVRYLRLTDKLLAEMSRKVDSDRKPKEKISNLKRELKVLRKRCEECRYFQKLQDDLFKLEAENACQEYLGEVRKREEALRQMETSEPACGEYAKRMGELHGKLRSDYLQQFGEKVGDLFRLLVEAIGVKGDKNTLVRRDGLGRRVDRSARLVVVPNPNLEWDEAGIPTLVLLELMGDLMTRWLKRLPQEHKKELPELQPISWLRPQENRTAAKDGETVLKAYLKAHPDFVVLLNRQPSLHRDSIQAFRPVPLSPDAGEVIQLCPLACKGFAADFDGDEMVVHLPLGILAQLEARKMLPSRNLFSLATLPPENVMAHFDQDFIMGNWLLGRANPTGLRDPFLALLPDGETKKMAESWGEHPSKKDGLDLLYQIASNASSGDEAAQILTAWMRVAFNACTRAGISYSYYELRELASGLAAQHAELRNTAALDINEALDRATEAELAKVLGLGPTVGAAGYGFAAMALSGARGRKQVRQIVAARGLLHPGATAFHYDPDDFVFRKSLVEGLSPAEAFQAAMNARSSMCDKKIGTAYAGGLSRDLVFALWHYRIVGEDCDISDSPRNPVFCRAKEGCCAACYKPLPDGTTPRTDFPVGLIAAQSFGERGTQLSMQSFHGGESEINIQWVRFALGLGKRIPGVDKVPFSFAHPDQAEDFVARIKEIPAYSGLLDRHLQIIWRVLHDLEGTRKVKTAIKERDAITRIAHRNPASEALTAAMLGEALSRTNPFSRILFGESEPTDGEGPGGLAGDLSFSQIEVSEPSLDPGEP